MEVDLVKRLRTSGWSFTSVGNYTLWYEDDNKGEQWASKIIKVVESTRDGWSDTSGRGQRNQVVDSPVSGERWFLKQYHHGGLLAGENDTYYVTPDRFLAELTASILARKNNISVPEPRAVLYREESEGFVGFYLSLYLESERFSKILRLSEDSKWARKAGRKLAQLHEINLDHQDFHVGNLRIDGSGLLLVTDLDPIDFMELSKWKRERRLQRFKRSMRKHGFHSSDLKAFRSGYEYESSVTSSMVSKGMFTAMYRLKGKISDLVYFLTKQPLEAINLEKVLVRAPNWLGDSVMSLPFLETLERGKGKPTVDVVARKSVASLYQQHKTVNETHTISDDKSWRLPDLKEERYSAFFVLPKSLRTGIQAFLSSIPRRIGFNTQGRSFLLTDRINLNERRQTFHHASLYFRLLKDDSDEPDTLQATKLSAPEIADRFQYLLDRPYITIHPGSAYGPAKRWPPEQFQRFVSLILEETDFRVVVLGVAEEKSFAEEIVAPTQDQRIKNLVGKTDLTELMSILSNSQGTVANDSGIMHLSGVLDTPTLGIFGSTDPSLTHPIGKRVDVLYENVECSPCFERTCPRDEDRYKCLTHISPGLVLERFEDLIYRE